MLCKWLEIPGLFNVKRILLIGFVCVSAYACQSDTVESDPTGYHDGSIVEFLDCGIQIPEEFFKAAVGEYNRNGSLIRMRNKAFDSTAVRSQTNVDEYRVVERGKYSLHSFKYSPSEDLSFDQSTLADENAHITFINISNDELLEMISSCR